jgi:hypothetical protein
MSVRLVFHRSSDKESPFDKCAINIADRSDLSVACPYLSLFYLRRILKQSNSWRLLTDIDEWLRIAAKAERIKIARFVKANSELVRHSPQLHAKVLIGNNGALVGSANLTRNGIQARTEMGVYLRDAKLRKQLSNWFDVLWKNSFEIQIDKLNELVEALPDLPSSPSARLITAFRRRLVPLVDIDSQHAADSELLAAANLRAAESVLNRKIVNFNSARGYKADGNRFCVLADSWATTRDSPTFNTLSGGRFRRLKDGLINAGVLTKVSAYYYVFTKKYEFNSPSEAAYIVDGNSRSGSKWQ